MELAARGEARGEEEESTEGRVLRRGEREKREKGRGDGEADVHAVVLLHSHLVKIYYAVVHAALREVANTTQHVHQPHLLLPLPCSLFLCTPSSNPSRDLLSKGNTTQHVHQLHHLPSPLPSSLPPSS